jgi:hypothetical protein
MFYSASSKNSVSIANGEPLTDAGAELRTYVSASAAFLAPFVRSVEAFVRHPEQARVGVAQFEDQQHRARDANRSESGQDDRQRVEIR